METTDHGFQKVNPYTQHLPYAEFLDEEADQKLHDIVVNLSSAVLQRDIRFGVAYWLTRLEYYMVIYDQRFTKEQHILFVKLLYSLITQPYLSYSVIEHCCKVLSNLLRKIKRLSRDDLQLEWRPLYEMVQRMCFAKKNRAGTLHVPTTKTGNAIWGCVKKCRMYFSIESTQEMMDEFRPMLCPSDVVCDNALVLMSNFLPILLPPEHHDKGFKLWFDELLELWLSLPYYDSRSASLMYLFFNLADVNIGYIDWTPYIPRLFNVFLRGFRLPPFTRTRAKDNVVVPDYPAKFIVCLLGANDTTAMAHFKKLMLTLKNFYHPSNAGSFQLRLQRFLCIAKYFCIRYHKERLTSDSWYQTIPESHRLTDDIVTEFCRCLHPIVEISMYSRYGSVETAKLLRDLVMLRPELFIPTVLDKSYAALETLNEPHQILNVIPCLAVVARGLLSGGKSVGTDNIARYPEGPTHLLPVLRCLLPGIDPNDFNKTVLTATVISAFATLVPIVDCSELVHSGRELTETEKALCEASAQWEDFLLQLLDRCFCVFEQLALEPEVTDNRAGVGIDDASQESMMGVRLSNSMLHLLQQCSPALFQVMCKRMFSFASSHILESKMAGSAFSDMLENACQVNPDFIWKLFFPHCHQQIMQIVADCDPKSEKADHHLVWNLQLLTALVSGVDDTVLQYKDELVEILHATVHMKNKETYSMALDVLANVMSSLTQLFCREKRSAEEDFSASPLDRDYLKDWGGGMHVDDIHVTWHIPNEEELDFAGVLLDKFLDPEIQKLHEVAAGKCEMEKEDLHCRLCILSACLEGAASILPMLGAGEPVIDPSSLQIDSCVPLATRPFRVTCPSQDKAAEKHKHRRQEAADVLHAVLDHIWSSREDDTTAMAFVTGCYLIVLMDEGCSREKIESRQAYNDTRTTVFFDRVTGKKNRPRSVLIDRVELQHLKRMNTRYYMPVTASHLAVLDRIIKLSLSQYTVVRITAQDFLSSFVYRFFGCLRYSLPTVMECLKESDALTHEQLKGALYILHTEAYLRFMSNRYGNMLSILPSLLQADHSDKPSIVHLVRAIIRELLVQGNYPSLEENMTDDCLAAGRSLAESCGLENIDSLIERGKEHELKVSKEHTEAYDGLISSLVQILSDEKVRLSHLQFCGGVLSALIRHDYPLPPAAVKVYLNGLVNDVLLYRKLSWCTMTTILRQLRHPTDKIVFKVSQLAAGGKSDTGGDDSAAEPSNTATDFPAGLRKDNAWILYDPDNLPDTEDKWQNFQFVHKPHLGYAGWPRELALYAPPGKQHSLADHLSDLSESEAMVRDAFLSEEFVSKLVGFFSQEVHKGRDVFDGSRFSLFKALFRNYLDSFVEIFRPHVERLALDTLDHNQRCAAELIAGMVSSCRHWSYDKIEAMKEWLIPLLRQVFQKVSMETARDWYSCVTSAVGDRDPRSLYWLYDLLLSCQMTSNGGTFGDGSRLHLMERAFSEAEWKAPYLLHRLNDLVHQNISNPYSMIRRSIASVLGRCVLRYDHPLQAVEREGQVPLRKDFMKAVLPAMEILLTADDNDSATPDPTSTASPAPGAQASASGAMAALAASGPPNMAQLAQLIEKGGQLPPQLLELMKNTPDEDKGPLLAKLMGGFAADADAASTSSDESEESMSLDEPDRAVEVPSPMDASEKTPPPSQEDEVLDEAKEQRAVATRAFKTVCSWMSSCITDPLNDIFAPLVPLICSQQGKEHDPELSQLVASAHRAMAFSLLMPGDFQAFLDALEAAVPKLGWRGRKASLNFIKCKITTNLFTSSIHADDMARCLELVLTLLQDDQQDVRSEASGCLSALVHVELVLVNTALLDQLKSLAATPLPKKRTLAQIAANYVPRDLVLRHAGTLGLCALIRAFPYTVPEWMPELLMVLDRHMSDPAPIQGTVRESLSEFKRTHHDNWAVDKAAFSDEQLQVLTELLISPSYYV